MNRFAATRVTAMNRYSALLEGETGPVDVHRPIDQWNGYHYDAEGNHVLCGPDGMWQIETPAPEFRRKLQIEALKDLAR